VAAASGVAKAEVDLDRPLLRREELHRETPAIEGSLMRRAAKEICGRVGEDGSAVAQLARDFGVGLCHGLHPAPRGAPLLGPRPHRGDRGGRDRRAQGAGGDQGPRCLLRHELRRLGAGQERRRRGLLAHPALAFLAPADRGGRHRPPRRLLGAISAVVPGVTVTVGHFQAIRLANWAVDDVCRRTQRSTLGQHRQLDDPLIAPGAS